MFREFPVDFPWIFLPRFLRNVSNAGGLFFPRKIHAEFAGPVFEKSTAEFTEEFANKAVGRIQKSIAFSLLPGVEGE